MSKRKILTLAMAVMMVAILAVGGSLAYFMDTDNADNVFTIGDVSIVLNEQERGEDGELTDFTQDKELFPIVGSAQGEKDANDLPVAKNYVDKVVTITNDGENEAWVRLYFAIPSALDDGYDTFNAGMNVLHFNFGSNNGATTYGVEWDWKTTNGKWNYFETTMNGIKYNVYFADHVAPVASGATTVRALDGVYLDSTVNFVDNEDLLADYPTVTTANGETYQMIADCNKDKTFEGVELDFDILNDGVVCPVFALGVQTAGFDTPDAAFDEAFGAQYNPWGGAVANWQN